MSKELQHEDAFYEDFIFEAFLKEHVTTKPGCWQSSVIQIIKTPLIKEDNKCPYRDITNITNVGKTYTYNYPGFRPTLFAPFKFNNNFYALYSVDYTATRVMRLFEKAGVWDWEDWCGEDGDACGFCPIEFYVPCPHKINLHSHPELAINVCRTITMSCGTWDIFIYNPSYAFISGCQWGDDSSWKLRYIDLSEIESKKITITDKFGYLELPAYISLKEAVSCTYTPASGNTGNIRIATALDYSMKTGKSINWEEPVDADDQDSLG